MQFMAANFFSITDEISINVSGTNPHNSGWWGSKEYHAGGSIFLNALGTPAPLDNSLARCVA